MLFPYATPSPLRELSALVQTASMRSFPPDAGVLAAWLLHERSMEKAA